MCARTLVGARMLVWAPILVCAPTLVCAHTLAGGLEGVKTLWNVEKKQLLKTSATWRLLSIFDLH